MRDQIRTVPGVGAAVHLPPVLALGFHFRSPTLRAQDAEGKTQIQGHPQRSELATYARLTRIVRARFQISLSAIESLVERRMLEGIGIDPLELIAGLIKSLATVIEM